MKFLDTFVSIWSSPAGDVLAFGLLVLAVIALVFTGLYFLGGEYDELDPAHPAHPASPLNLSNPCSPFNPNNL